MKFKLSDSFLEEFKTTKPDWGPLGEVTYLRTYSRKKEDGTNEKWWETVKRVVEGVYNIQKEHCDHYKLPWNNAKAQKSAQIMYNKIFNFKFTPSGRGLWMMGTDFVNEKGAMALLNCAFITTEDISTRGSFPFTWAMDSLMLGVGVGFDTKGANKVTIKQPKEDGVYQIPDSREGWVESLKILIDSYLDGNPLPTFDYSIIRPYGAVIKGFGGVASGPEPLMTMHKGIASVLDKKIGQKISSVDIVDIMDMIGVCVVAGNVRRSAMLALGDWSDKDYVTMKDYNLHPEEVKTHRWSSNNSIIAEVGKTNYSEFVDSIVLNGEPGLVWLNNIRSHGRMSDLPDSKDKYVAGVNPCQPAWAKLLTPEGIKNLGDIKIGDKVWSKEGWTTVINKWSTGVKKVNKYQTTSSIFYGTENHRVVSGGIKVEVKDAETIENLTGPFNSSYIIDPQDVMDGLVLGDGMVHQASNNKVLLCVGEKDSDYFKSEVRDLFIKERFGISPFAYDVKTTISYKELPKTWERRIPNRYILNPNKLVGLLRGLFSANGTVADNRISIKMSSKGMMEDVQLALSSLGIRSYFTTNKPSTIKFSNGEYTCKESYDVNITVDREKFVKIIGFIQTYKNEKISIVESVAKKKDYDIVNIEFVSEEEVYDITVDNPSHTYWTQGCNVSNCSEIVLESAELCNLVETFPSRHESLEEFKETLKYAYLYAKTVTLIPTHVPETNAVMMKNRRIGISQTGIIDAFVKHGRRKMMEWSDAGYKHLRDLDELYSNWLCIPRSIRITTVKPSGTTALLPGVSAGIHYPHSEYYIRRIRIASNSPLVLPLCEAGYSWEYSAYGMTEEEKQKTLVFSFPVHEKYFDKGKEEASIWEQIKNVVDYQRWWSDNAVSVTVTFKKQEAHDIPLVLEAYEDSLKTISFLPLEEHGYVQAPYETISKEKYLEMVENLKIPDFSVMTESIEAVGDKYCTTDGCLVKS